MDAFFYSVPPTEVAFPWWGIVILAIGAILVSVFLCLDYHKGLFELMMSIGYLLMFIGIAITVFVLAIAPSVRTTIGFGVDITKVISEHYGAHDVQKAVCPDGSDRGTCFTYTAGDGSREFVRAVWDWDGDKAGYNITVEHLGNRLPAPTPTPTPSSKETSS